MNSANELWKDGQATKNYLDGVRAAIPLAELQIDVMIRLVRHACPHLRNFLDLGCGDGVLGRSLLDAFPAASGVLVDFSEPMLARAQQALSGYGERVRILQADYAIPSWTAAFSNSMPFDAVVSGFSIHHQPDETKRRIYSDIFDLLAGGGIFLNLEHVLLPSKWLDELFDDIFIDSLHAHHIRTGGSKTKEQIGHDLYYAPVADANILSPTNTQCQWLTEIGFENVDSYLRIFALDLFGGTKPNGGTHAGKPETRQSETVPCG